ncbi:MAG: gamma-glutamyl-gamma-aminobutyrate hydrolase family protein, partial [Pontibacter sp.]|nr:gamma-glutamyl-gamma-aminobutyrate hydrolase family protein [Pontibacter sp.]
FAIGRYHSWLVEQELPDCLIPTAVDEQGNIMAMRHKAHKVRGVQFHPESVLTEHGREMIKNWLES